MQKYFILSFCLAFVSCKSSTDTGSSSNPANSGFIMPLAVGNIWEYNDQTFHDQISGSFNDTLRLVTKFLFLTDTVYSNEYQTYYANRKDGLWTLNYGSTEQVLIAKYPGSAGDIFGHDTFIITSESGPDPLDSASANVRIDSVNAAVTVPAGNYSCYKYNADYYNSKHQLLLRQNAYYSVNTGLIKRETFELDSISQTLKLSETYQLTGVQLK